MDFKLGRINLNAVAQGVGGLVFGNENSSSAEDSYVERYLDRISNGVLAEDRRAAMNELQTLVAESRSAQLAFGATGLPILMKVLREERDDVEMIRGALETLVGALTSIDTSHGQKNEVQPASMNSDLLSREPESISHLLSLLSEDDFYIRYYTLQLLTALLTHSPSRLQEAILSTPRGVTRLVDMLMDREVIRNEALLLLTHLTREAEEIQKILVFEGVFEKIFSIIKEEGGSEGGVVVQDCLELLNNLIRKNASNQVLLKETIGFEPLISVLKLHRGSAYNFTQQKTINLLSALDTVELLLMGGVDGEPGKNGNRLANQSVLGQKKILDYLLMLGVESQWASLSVRCSALRCIGTLIYLNPQNLDMLANKFVGEEPHIEPALNSILRIILRTSTVQEFVAADHVFKCFCEKNKDGQTMLASSMTSQPNSSHQPSLDSNNLSFGSMLLHGLIFNDNDGDLEASCRAASVLFHILKDNSQCKERVLRIVLEVPVPSLGSPEPLLHRIVKYLALTSSKSSIEESANEPGGSYKETLFLRLLVAWLADCPASVDCFLDSPAHLTYMLELLTNSSSSAYVHGLTSVILGECVLYNKKSEGNRDAFAVVDAISQKIGLASYFMNFDELQKIFAHTSSTLLGHHRPVTRSSAASISDMEDRENEARAKQEQHPIFTVVFDHQFVDMIKKLELEIRESIVDVFSHPKNTVAVVPAELEQKNGEPDGDYIKRLKLFVQKQCTELQELLGRNATLAEDLARNGVARDSDSSYKPGSGNEKVQSEMLRRDIKEATERAETLKAENAKLEAQATMYKNLAAKTESDLKSLSDAYNSLEHANFRLESELKISRKGGSESYPDVEAIRAEAREEAQKESEAELNDLLVCLGQEQSKVERLSARLAELGEDVDSLLEGIGDEAGLPEEFDDADEN